jgi:hypothetical protein
VTTVRETLPTRPVTSQHPGVGKMTAEAWKPVGPYPAGTQDRTRGAVASSRRPVIVRRPLTPRVQGNLTARLPFGRTSSRRVRMTPRGYITTQSRPFPWLDRLAWPGGLSPLGSVTGHGCEDPVVLGVPGDGVRTAPDVADGTMVDAVVSRSMALEHEARISTTTAADPRTFPVHHRRRFGSRRTLEIEAPRS